MKWHTKELEMMSVVDGESLFLSAETFDFPLRWFVYHFTIIYYFWFKNRENGLIWFIVIQH